MIYIKPQFWLFRCINPQFGYFVDHPPDISPHQNSDVSPLILGLHWASAQHEAQLALGGGQAGASISLDLMVKHVFFFFLNSAMNMASSSFFRGKMTINEGRNRFQTPILLSKANLWPENIRRIYENITSDGHIIWWGERNPKVSNIFFSTDLMAIYLLRPRRSCGHEAIVWHVWGSAI